MVKLPVRPAAGSGRLWPIRDCRRPPQKRQCTLLPKGAGDSCSQSENFLFRAQIPPHRKL